MTEYELYSSGLSIPMVSERTGIPKSTLRFRFKRAGILRSRNDAITIAAAEGRLGSGNRGKKRKFTDSWCSNISKSKKGIGLGRSIKQNGYVEITMGEHKGRLEHIIVMESIIGRRLYSNECVHHIDHNRSNNAPENLALMTRSEHAKLHAIENNEKRQRDAAGRYK